MVAMNHTIIHFEIPANDLGMMKEFYSRVFGWKANDVPGMDYAVMHTVPTDEKGMLLEPGVNGGIYQRTSKVQVPINYIQVESVDDYMDRVTSEGGSILAPKQHIQGVGYIAWVSDPEGNPIGLITPQM